MSRKPFSNGYRYILTTLIICIVFCTLLSAASRSKQDWYNLFKKQSGTVDDPMDRQLFGLRRRIAVSGRVYSQRTGRPIGGALIRVFQDKGRKLTETKSRKNGFFSFQSASNTPIIVRVRHRWYTAQQKSFSHDMLGYPLLIPLLSSYPARLSRGRKITVYDTTGKVSLTVHADVLRRLDKKPVRFPVKIRISYINPQTDLDAMPGRQMLSAGLGGHLSPLLSYGAALIEAVDAEGKRVIADPQLMRRLNMPTELRFNMEQFITGRDIRPADLRFKPWQMYPGTSVWKPFPGKMEPVYTRIRQEQGESRRSRWKTSVLIRAVELVAFNLDVPKKAVPLLFTFRQRGGRGKFLVSVQASQLKGMFRVSQFFNTDGRAFFRLLVPDVRFLTVSIFTKPGRTIPLLRRRIPISGRSGTFVFNRKKQIRTAAGKKPVWRRVPLMLF